jgi:aminobenzoyl-glutamate utilization protein B
MYRQNIQNLKKNAIDWINTNEEHLIKIANQVWENAETSLQEYKSSKLIANELEKEGFAVKRGVADMPTAFVATYGSGKPVIGILGEYDALPGLSQRPVPKKETLKEAAPGHGCGHNLLGTGAAGAAMAAKDVMDRSRVPGTIRYFGCPAEETLVGKVFMVKAGLFNDVDAALTWHPWCANTVWLDSTLAMNSVKFKFHGVAAHAAASPEAGRSALDAVELMNVGINYLREHIVQDARIHYIITHGGEAPNIVPDFAEVWCYIRAPKWSDVEAVYNRICNIAKGAALMTGTKEDIEFITEDASFYQIRHFQTFSIGIY